MNEPTEIERLRIAAEVYEEWCTDGGFKGSFRDYLIFNIELKE